MMKLLFGTLVKRLTIIVFLLIAGIVSTLPLPANMEGQLHSHARPTPTPPGP